MSDDRTTGILTLDPPPAIVGLRIRPFDPSTDYAPLSALMGAANVVDDIPYLPTGENLKVEMEHMSGLDPVRDVVVVELDGRMIASSNVERNLRDDVPTYEIWGVVDPAFRRRGIGTSLLAWSEARSRERADLEDPDVAVKIGTYVEQTEAGRCALIARTAMQPVRHFFLMRRTTLDDVPDLPLPPGLEIRPVMREQWRAIFDAETEAFRDHWGRREKTDADFEMTYTMPELDTDLWVVAWDGDQIAGVVQNWIWPEENARLQVKRGWLEHISVRRPWRRRGLARAITARSLVKLRDAGMDDAMLGVDSENPNGALGLYEGLGFTVHNRGAAYSRVLDR